eukprot:13090029-Heterocapsa_arctica.AAC.1
MRVLLDLLAETAHLGECCGAVHHHLLLLQSVDEDRRADQVMWALLLQHLLVLLDEGVAVVGRGGACSELIYHGDVVARGHVLHVDRCVRLHDGVQVIDNLVVRHAYGQVHDHGGQVCLIRDDRDEGVPERPSGRGHRAYEAAERHCYP